MMVLLSTIFYYVVGFLVLALSAIWLYFRHIQNYWSNKNVTVIPSYFILGALPKTLKHQISGGEEVTERYNEYKAKGERICAGSFLHMSFVMLIDPELVKNVVIRDFNHFMDRGIYCNEENDPLSAHLFTLSGDKWRHLRQKLTPTFTSGRLKQMFQTLVDCTDELKDCLDGSIAKAEPIDIKKVLAKYTTDVIGSCAFGIDCNSFKNPNSDFIKMGGRAIQPTVSDMFRMVFIFLLPKIANLLKLKFNCSEVERFFRNLVKDTIEYRETNNITRDDFMQLLMKLKNNERIENEDGKESEENIEMSLTLNEVTAQAVLFFVAGFESSSTTMSFCLFELSKNLDVQQKARDEIIQVLKKHDGKLTYEALMEMHYLERVIQETLRKHPPAMVLQRVVTEEYTVPDTDLVLEKGIGVLIPILGLQMDPEYFPDPEKFDPDRFTEENKASRPDCTYLPFGDGPRNCIGLRFGMMLTKVGICRLLCSYKFTLNQKTADPIVLDTNTFNRSVRNGVWLNAEKNTT